MIEGMMEVDTMMKYFEQGLFLSMPDDEMYLGHYRPVRMHYDYVHQTWTEGRQASRRRKKHAGATQTMIDEGRRLNGTLKLKNLLGLCAGVLMEQNIHPFEASTEEWYQALTTLVEKKVVHGTFLKPDYYLVFKVGISRWCEENKRPSRTE